MAAKKTTKKTSTKKPTTTDLRVLAWRVQPDQFDAMTTACEKHGITKTALLNEGIALALTKRGEARAAEKFKA